METVRNHNPPGEFLRARRELVRPEDAGFVLLHLHHLGRPARQVPPRLDQSAEQ
ncbi:hypothetical protein AB5J52_47540 [Streptomyces sp. R39]|uniref:Uncharacterized protein n=1 Tax=Streptomyces sp. R39 TaxID=3238631 RepID=A0AB39R570_9ACTN